MTLRAAFFVVLLVTGASLAGVVVGFHAASGDAAGAQPAEGSSLDRSLGSNPRLPTETPEAAAPLELVEVTSSPSTPRAGELYELSVTVRNAGADTWVFLLDVESYVEVAPDDWKKDPQRIKDQVRLDAGATRTYTFGMESREPGPHVVHVGAFAPGWGEVIVFWDAALFVTVSPAE